MRRPTYYPLGLSCIHTSFSEREDPMWLIPPNIKPNMKVPIKPYKGCWLSTHLVFAILPLGQDTQCSVHGVRHSNFLQKETSKLKAIYCNLADFSSQEPSPHLPTKQRSDSALENHSFLRALWPQGGHRTQDSSQTVPPWNPNVERTSWNCPNPGLL